MKGRVICALALLAIPACTSAPGGLEGYETFFAVLRERTGPAPEPQPITWASIGDFSEPLLYAALPSRNANALLGLAMRNGQAESWMTPDNIALILRGGVVIGTRGLGEDLMSVSVSDVRTARGPAPRTNFYIGGDEATLAVPFDCQIVAAGRETIEILDRTQTALRVEETCEGNDFSIANTYWLDSRGHVRKSRQWVSESVGYITVERLID